LRREVDVRRAAVVAIAALVVTVGAIAIRGSDLTAFAHFLGATTEEKQQPEQKIETYAHRTLLAWLGFEIWKDDPILGVGWEGSREPPHLAPYPPRAHASVPPQ